MGSKDRITTADCLCNLWHDFSERSAPSVQTKEAASSRNRQGFFYILGGAGDISHLKLRTEMGGAKGMVEVFHDLFKRGFKKTRARVTWVIYIFTATGHFVSGDSKCHTENFHSCFFLCKCQPVFQLSIHMSGEALWLVYETYQKGDAFYL